MGSLVAETEKKKKAMWLYPKVLGFNPSERWGHSACFSGGLMYVFGGCCGGLHFSDVLTLDLERMQWSKLATTGEKPGPRDSHSAVLVGHKMIVFGGTNGFRKVNDTHILDLVTKEWIHLKCEGTPPSPRESHTATLVGDERLVIFGGSGEGEANYLNDLHVLDLGTMRWSSPEVKGDFPVPRDSHIALAIGDKVVVYGGDSGDMYHGDVSMLDMETMTWSRLKVQGSSPGVRAGHAAVNIGNKLYIIGGVGDKCYCNDIWVFDIFTCSWTQLVIPGQQPQGRFSHTAVVTDMDIAIYGGCGEDERPLNELLVLQLGAEFPNGRYNISGCKVFGTYWNQEKRTTPGEADINSKIPHMGNNVEVFGKWGSEVASERALPYQFNSGTYQQKRRKIAPVKVWDVESEQEEHSLSLSQHSSPSQSDQEQTQAQKANASAMDSHRVKLIHKIPSNWQHGSVSSYKRVLKNVARRSPQDLHHLEYQPTQERYLHVDDDINRGRHQAAEHKPMARGYAQQLVGAEVRGKVDGAFDSGLLMTATVNGRVFRGVLFAPVGAGVSSTSVEPNCSLPCLFPSSTQPLMNSNHVENLRGLRQPLLARPSPIMRGSAAPLANERKVRSDLQGLVLTLGGPAASGNHA
ncbi:serine/threonine-protein phosphatase BSL1 homolog isoform X2 [Lotus japonicus]|uniref:serine/threonine-protein phosphatase BSL1 homolog isoform X2 n=1 Tax=Lotus japonicus TaxID=34305 RepID=UPI002583A2B4|nr:serine/threonine-protein phosphatase BSL1 homolog isoform X2 [Lotus japonicus]